MVEKNGNLSGVGKDENYTYMIKIIAPVKEEIIRSLVETKA